MTQLQKRIQTLEAQVVISDDPKNKLLYFDAKVDGKRIASKARYGKRTTREQARQKNRTEENGHGKRAVVVLP